MLYERVRVPCGSVTRGAWGGRWRKAGYRTLRYDVALPAQYDVMIHRNVIIIEAYSLKIEGL